jgi:hypothetical protein
MRPTLTFLLLLVSFVCLAEVTTMGRVETGLLGEQCIPMRIKMDTGAKTASVNAHNIKIIEKNKEKWVQFILDPDRTPTLYTLELPLVRTVKIRKRAAESQNSDPYEYRPVVLLPVTLGKSTHSVEVSLTNRSHFNYGMILGRTAMEQFNIHINPQTAFTRKAVCPSEKKVVD